MLKQCENKDFLLIIFVSAFAVVSLVLAIMTSVGWSLKAVLICILMAKDVEHLWRYFSVTTVSSFEDSVQFHQIFNRSICFLWILILGSLKILDNNNLPDIKLAKSFFPFRRLPLQSINTLLSSTGASSFYEASIVDLHPVPCTTRISWGIFPTLSFRNFWSNVKIFDLFLLDFCSGGEIR